MRLLKTHLFQLFQKTGGPCPPFRPPGTHVVEGCRAFAAAVHLKYEIGHLRALKIFLLSTHIAGSNQRR